MGLTGIFEEESDFFAIEIHVGMAVIPSSAAALGYYLTE